MPTTLIKNPVDISGTAAAATPTAGAKPPNALTIAGAAGQATTGTGVAAGAGADVSITAGAGGAAVTGATRGSGGSVTINPGAPATGAGTGGTYGAVLLATEGGRVGMGTTSPISTLEITGTLPTFTSTRISAGNAASLFTMRKANTGTTAVANGNQIAQWTFAGYDGSTYVAGTRISAFVDGAVSGGTVPMAIAFSTGGQALEQEAGTLRDDDNALTERLRMTSGGDIGIGTPAPSSKLHINGGVQVGIPTGGDMGTGTINVAGDIYVNGTPLLEQLEETRRLVSDLKKRTESLEGELARIAGKDKR